MSVNEMSTIQVSPIPVVYASWTDASTREGKAINEFFCESSTGDVLFQSPIVEHEAGNASFNI
jgi:hypothetical protein